MKACYDAYPGIVSIVQIKSISISTWVLWLRIQNTCNTVDDTCRVYRTTDSGVTWTLVQNTNRSDPESVNSIDILGDRIAWGSYRQQHEPGFLPTIYISLDQGQTWDLVWQDTSNLSHVHFCRWDATDPNYLLFHLDGANDESWGSYPTRTMMLHKPSGWVHGGGVWDVNSTITTDAPIYAPIWDNVSGTTDPTVGPNIELGRSEER